MPLPNAEDFGFGSLDEKCACEHFLGRTLEDAEALFRDEPYLYCEDLMWMGGVAFRYYVSAAVRALLHSSHVEDAYALASFAGTLEHRLECCPEELTPIAQEIAASCGAIIETHADAFLAQAEIYCDLRSRYAALQDAIRNLAAQHSAAANRSDHNKLCSEPPPTHFL